MIDEKQPPMETLEIHFISNNDGTYTGTIVCRVSEDTVFTIEYPDIKKNNLELSQEFEVINEFENNTLHYVPYSSYLTKVRLVGDSLGKYSITFSELIDYLNNKNAKLSKQVKNLMKEKSQIINESSKQNKKYKKIINSLQKTIGRLIDINKKV